jgi:hypothetical protein
VLDRRGGNWRVDHNFSGRLPRGTPAQFAVSALRGVTFATDGRGRRLPAPVSVLLASVWDLRGISQMFARNDRTGVWTAMNLAAPKTATTRLQQVRALGFHGDRRTGVDMVFVGQSPYGIYSGVYDRTAPGRIRWSSKPELNLSRVSTTFPGLGGRLRISSFAELDGVLYAAAGQEIYRRLDGARPRWRAVYTNSDPGYSQTGLRGLTAVRNPTGRGQVLLAAVEGTVGRIVRIDPRSGYKRTTELDVNAFLGQSWGAPVTYTISAYSNMIPVPSPHGGQDLLIGVEGHYRSAAAPPAIPHFMDGRGAPGIWSELLAATTAFTRSPPSNRSATSRWSPLVRLRGRRSRGTQAAFTSAATTRTSCRCTTQPGCSGLRSVRRSDNAGGRSRLCDRGDVSGLRLEPAAGRQLWPVRGDDRNRTGGAVRSSGHEFDSRRLRAANTPVSARVGSQAGPNFLAAAATQPRPRRDLGQNADRRTQRSSRTPGSRARRTSKRRQSVSNHGFWILPVNKEI